MSREIDKNMGWDSTLRDQIRDLETPPSRDLWGDIEQELELNGVANGHGIAPPSHSQSAQRDTLWRWMAGVAAVAAVTFIAISIWFADITSTMDSEVAPMVVQVQEEMNVDADEATEFIDIEAIEEATIQYASAKLSHSPKRNAPAAEAAETETIAIESSVTEEKSESESEAGRTPIDRSNSSNNSNRYNSSNSYNDGDKFYATKKSTDQRTTLSILGSGSIIADNTVADRLELTSYDALLFPDGLQNDLNEIYDYCDIKHHQPFSIGFRVQQPISERFSVVSGLNYTRLLSDISYGNDFNEQQKIHLLGLPIRLYYNLLSTDNLRLYTGFGGAVEYCLGAKVGDVRADERAFHLSANFVAGAEYRLNKWFGLYFEPEISHYLTTTKLKSIINDSPINLTLQLGISLTL